MRDVFQGQGQTGSCASKIPIQMYLKRHLSENGKLFIGEVADD